MDTHVEQFRAFARYNREFNARLYEIVAGLDDAVRRDDMGAFFGSIYGTLNHILLADRIWLGRFATAWPELAWGRSANVIREFSSLRQEVCADFSDLLRERRATDADLEAFAGELTPELLAGNMRYRNAEGEPREHVAWIAIAHVFNHQTHHRGQVTALLYRLGHDPGVTDFVKFAS